MVCPLQQYSPVVIARSNDSLMNAVDFCTAKFRHTEMGKLLIFVYSNSVNMRVYQDSPCIALPLTVSTGQQDCGCESIVRVGSGADAGLKTEFLWAKSNRESKNGHHFLDHFWVNRRYLG
jgi:hypothetical protein